VAATRQRDVPDDVMALVRTVPAWTDADVVVSELHGGITNRNYRIDVGGRSYVIRLPGERTELLGIDRAGEIEAAHRAASLGIGPGVFGVLPGTGTVITEFVPGVAVADSGELLSSGRLEAVVDAVAALHRSPPIAAVFPIFRVIERHAVDAVAHGASLPDGHGVLTTLMNEIEAVFMRHGARPVPCHNDLLPANVLFDGDRPWLIDYEYAGMNEAMFDLANLSVNAGFDGAADNRLLERYSGRAPSDSARAQLALMKVVSEMREGMWALVQQGISGLAGFDFGAYAAERLSNCRTQAGSASFVDALAGVAS